MLRHAIGHARLMRESTDCIQSALRSADDEQQTIAKRILENPTMWHQWESEHSVLMRQLANCGMRHTQVVALKQTNFKLLHGKALFQYLQRSEIRGDGRAQLLAHFRPGRSYADAVIDEHSLYLRKSASHLCTHHLGQDVVEDPTFLDPMQHYEELYTEYFGVYCSTLVKDASHDLVSQKALLPLLKKQLNEYRLAIVDPRKAQPWLRREAELRMPTGDTQRLQSLGPRGRK